jgi:hypothetical protein
VTVVNPSTNPALTSRVDDPGRNAYQSFIAATNCEGLGACLIHFPAVPTGHRLVIEHVTGSLKLSSQPNFILISVLNKLFRDLSDFSPAVLGLGNSVFDQPVLIYLDGGDTPTLTLSLIGANAHFANIYQSVTLSGYLLDCTAIPCAPIAH